mmetsp:Transcript_27194/g.105871  ORF Transcript_27194/g.105871 Transcript_27194/m.105871 type:complete len:460 (-) Transcript_27194:2158-3537(-)
MEGCFVGGGAFVQRSRRVSVDGLSGKAWRSGGSWGSRLRSRPIRCAVERQVLEKEEVLTSEVVEDTPPPPVVQPSKRQVLVSLALLIATDKALIALFRTLNIQFPASLFGMLAMFGSLLVLDVFKPEASTKVAGAYQPGVNFLAKWLAVCFAPSLVVLPLTPMPASADLLRTVCVLFLGWAMSLLSAAYVAIGLQKLSASQEEEATTPAAPIAMPPYRKLAKILGASTAGTFLLSLASGSFAPVVAAYTLSATLLGFCLGNLMNKDVKKIIHPLITCTLTALCAIFVLAQASGVATAGLLAGYITRAHNLTQVGGGDLLLSLLGPAVVSFAFQMYSRKKIMKQRALEVIGASFYASIFGLFGTAFLARLFNASAYVRKFLIPRQLTAPLAIRAAEALSADIGLCLSVVVLTGLIGANFGRLLLDIFKIRDPAARGIATGARYIYSLTINANSSDSVDVD